MAQETKCQTPDANYSITISKSRVEVVVNLPSNAPAWVGATHDEQLESRDTLESNIHNAMELVLAPLFVRNREAR